MPCIATLRGHTDWVQCVAISLDGTRVISASQDSTLRVWDLTHPMIPCIATLTAHTRSVSSVSISPDDTRAISASWDNTLRVWDITHPMIPCIATLTGHAGPVWSVAISPDGTRAISGSDDCTLRVWPLFKFDTIEKAHYGADFLCALQELPTMNYAELAELASTDAQLQTIPVGFSPAERMAFQNKLDEWQQILA
jgi:WD40 repeat protein